jgi:hypothetical protein
VQPNAVAAAELCPDLGVAQAGDVHRPPERERPLRETDHDAGDSPVRRIRGQEQATTNRLQEHTILRGSTTAKGFEILPAILR